MSHISNVALGLMAASVTFGAVQLASGSDLGTAGGVSRVPGTVVEAVNRTAKSDRAAVLGTGGAGQTLSFQTDRVVGTSVLLRLPAAPVETISAPPKLPSPDLPDRSNFLALVFVRRY